jgi:hypothetical protein
MGQRASWAGTLGRWLLAGVLGTGTGCMGFIHPVPPAPKELCEPCRSLPQACRGHVYVFLVGGMDPCHWANLGGLCSYLNSLGFTKTYCGELYHCWYFDSEIKKLHREDPEARFVLLGFSFGANVVRNLAQSAAKDGITIDLLVYCGGNTLKDCPRDRPENCLKIVNVLVSSGFIWNGDTLQGADNAEVDGGWHFSSPTNPYTVNALVSELAVIAARVPFVAPRDPVLPPEEAPAPRRLGPAEVPEPTTARDEWDFLKPVQHLHKPVDAAATGAEPGTSVPGAGVPQVREEPARPVWIRGQLAPGEQCYQVACPCQ